MTEPDVASSDASNISTSITKSADGRTYSISGRKHWISNSSHPKCKLYILVGKSNPTGERYTSQSVVLIPKYQEDGTPTPGIKVLHHMHVFGYDDAPKGHDAMVFENVRLNRPWYPSHKSPLTQNSHSSRSSFPPRTSS